MLRRTVFLVVAALIGATLVVGGRGAAVAGPNPRADRYLLSLAPDRLQARSVDDVGRSLSRAFRLRLADVRPTLAYLGFRGVIRAYTVHAGDGFVEVETTAEGARQLALAFGGADVYPASPAGLRAHTGRVTALAHRAAGAAPVRAAGSGITANLSINSSGVSGNAPDGVVVYGKLYDSSGNLIAKGQDRSDGGYYYFSFCTYQCTSIFGGYRVRLTAGAATQNFNIPALNVSANRATDVVSGTGPRNKGVIVEVTKYAWTADTTTSTNTPLGVIANAQGRFSLDFSAFADILGGDNVEVRYNYPDASGSVTFNTDAPQIYGYLDSVEAGGSGPPASLVKFTVHNKRGRVIFSESVRTDPGGSFDLELVEAGAAAGLTGVPLRPGMRIGIDEPGVSVILPKLTAKLSTSARTVSGRGPANLFYYLYTSQPYYNYRGQIGADGRYTRDVTPAEGSLTAETAGYIQIRLNSGDYVYRTYD